MTQMRAKLRIAEVQNFSSGQTLIFNAVGKNGSYGQYGQDEDNTFARFTPSAYLSMSIQNPNLLGVFNVGDTFYVDFTKVDQ